MKQPYWKDEGEQKLLTNNLQNGVYQTKDKRNFA